MPMAPADDAEGCARVLGGDREPDGGQSAMMRKGRRPLRLSRAAGLSSGPAGELTLCGQDMTTRIGYGRNSTSPMPPSLL